MSISFGEKIKLIREALKLSQVDFSELVGVGISSLKKNESGVSDASSPTLQKIAEHPISHKYALWLISGQTNPEAGQIAPGDEIPEQSLNNQTITKDEFDQEFVKTVADSLLMFCHLGWFEPNTEKVDFDDCGKLVLKDVTPLLNKMPQHQQSLNLINKTG